MTYYVFECLCNLQKYNFAWNVALKGEQVILILIKLEWQINFSGTFMDVLLELLQLMVCSILKTQ